MYVTRFGGIYLNIQVSAFSSLCTVKDMSKISFKVKHFRSMTIMNFIASS